VRRGIEGEVDAGVGGAVVGARSVADEVQPHGHHAVGHERPTRSRCLICGRVASLVSRMAAPFLTFSALIDESERTALHDYALQLKADDALAFNAYGKNRYFQCIWGGPLVTPLIREVAARLEARFGLAGMPVDPELGWVISVIYHGGFVHPHTDARLYGGKPLKHLRCNVVVAKPEGGGTPVIGKKPVPLIERGGWAFFASEVEHSAFPVNGARPRIIYQFGYSVPEAWELPA